MEKNKVLILGAGMVAKPMIEYLLQNGFTLLVASPMKKKADEIINGHPSGKAINWSMDETGTLEKLIYENDLVVSLLPFQFHVNIALVCLKYKRPLVTTSYVKPEMRLLDKKAIEAGVIFLNEIGLDPGIDHMSAMRIIDNIHNSGGVVESFYSYCGALPAPEANDNPLKYKFTWSPKGVVQASRNEAIFLKNEEKIIIEAKNLFKNRFPFNFQDIEDLEVYPNRDSISYIDIYGIPETKNMFRGTLRFRGWCETLDAMNNLNLFDDKVMDYKGKYYMEFMADCAGVNTDNIKQNVATELRLSIDSVAIKALEWLGLFENKIMSYGTTTPFEVTSDRMIKKMMLSDKERDMVILQHVVLALYPSGKKEVIRSSMLSYGSPSTNTSIARAVALPAAIAVKLILEKKIDLKGVHIPVIPQIYNPVLNELKTLGIEMKEEYGLPESEIQKLR